MVNADDLRRWLPRAIGFLLLAMYSRAIFADPSAFVGQLCGLCKPGDETPAEVWKATPTQIKGAIYQTGGWAAAFAIMIINMSFSAHGLRGLCKGIAIAFTLWQFFWYVRILPVSGVPVSTILLKESLQEIIFVATFGYLGFVSPTDCPPKGRGKGCTATVRVIMLVFVSSLLTAMQTYNYLFNNPAYASMELGMVDPRGQDDQAVWDKTPTHSKILTLEQAGWVTCLTAVIASMLIFEPGCDRALCIGMSLVMMWWNCVWYLGVYGHVDVDGDYKVQWYDIAKNEAPFEIPFILLFGFLGCISWGQEEDGFAKVQENAFEKPFVE